MKNLFDSENYPEKEPKEVTATYQWAWSRPDVTETYPTAEYTLRYKFIALSSGESVVFSAQKIAEKHVLVLTGDQTALNPGEYSWDAIIVRDSDSNQVLVDEGFIKVKHSDGLTESHNYKVLAAIRANLEGTATSSQQSMSIAGRSLSRYGLQELMSMEQEYGRRWKKEKADIDKANGRKSNNHVRLKMGA